MSSSSTRRGGFAPGALLLVSLGLGLGACAAFPGSAPPSPAALAQRHRDRADLLARQGDLKEAADELAVALTVDPKDTAAQAARRNVEARIERTVAERIGQGREALARGSHLEARRHFLAVLALDPFNKTAFGALQNEVRVVRFVTHTVRQGDTAASIAERYYGDRTRAELIEEVNQLRPNARLAAGATLRIPEIPGVPFRVLEAAPPPTTPGAPPPVREEPEVNPLLADAREAFERGEYVVALGDVDRLLASSPQHREGLDLKKQILYEIGKGQFAEKKYASSYQTLSQLARLAPDYEDSGRMLRTARELLVRQHYNQGLQLFREEKLPEAIAEWRQVLEYDPGHVNAQRNIEQAERMLRALEQRQQPRQPPRK